MVCITYRGCILGNESLCDVGEKKRGFSNSSITNHSTFHNFGDLSRVPLLSSICRRHSFSHTNLAAINTKGPTSCNYHNEAGGQCAGRTQPFEPLGPNFEILKNFWFEPKIRSKIVGQFFGLKSYFGAFWVD